MIYEWRCGTCHQVTEVHHSIADNEVPPDDPCMKCHIPTYPQVWTKVITSAPPVMWEDARDKGVFDRIYRV
jgi:hypothetical protein